MAPQHGKHVENGQFFQATAVGVETIYAVAPSLFLGNRRSSYAHLFGFSFRVGTTEGMNFRFGDIVLEGANGLKVSAILTGNKYYIYEILFLTIPLYEAALFNLPYVLMLL